MNAPTVERGSSCTEWIYGEPPKLPGLSSRDWVSILLAANGKCYAWSYETEDEMVKTWHHTVEMNIRRDEENGTSNLKGAICGHRNLFLPRARK